MVKRFYLFACLVWIQLVSLAGVVTGSVKDAENGEELIGATVMAENGQGAITDMDGKFTLDLPKGIHTLTVRYIGYQTQTQDIQV